MSLTLKQALTIAEQYVGEDNHTNCVILTPGFVQATNMESGCTIPCDEVTVDLTVEAAALKRMVSAIGTEFTMSVEKGRKLELKSGSAKFRLQAIPDGKKPTILSPPKKGWVPWPEELTAPLTEAASIAADTGPMTGLHVDGAWISVGDHRFMVLLWVKDPLIADPLTVPGGVLKGLHGTLHVCGHKKALWVREEATGQVRWHRAFAYPYPDGSVMDLTARTRGTAGFTLPQPVSASDLMRLAKQAQAAAATKAALFKLTASGEHLTLASITGEAAYGTREYVGRVQVGALPDTSYVGVSPHVLHAVLKVLAAVGDEMKVTIRGPKQPPTLMVSSGPVAVEVLMTPTYIA